MMEGREGGNVGLLGGVQLVFFGAWDGDWAAAPDRGKSEGCNAMLQVGCLACGSGHWY